MLIISALIIISLIGLNCDKANIVATQTIFDNVSFSLESNKTISYALNIKAESILEAKVIEQFGKNIEFEVLQDGKNVFNSGVKQGNAEGIVKVKPGIVSFIIKNLNMFDAKSGYFTVKLK